MKKIVWIAMLFLIILSFHAAIAKKSSSVRAQKDARAVQAAEKKAEQELKDAFIIPKFYLEAEAAYNKAKDDKRPNRSMIQTGN